MQFRPLLFSHSNVERVDMQHDNSLQSLYPISGVDSMVSQDK